MFHGKKIVVVMPAYNAARTLERTFAEIPLDVVDDVILVDDASRDDTVDGRARPRAADHRPRPEPRLRRQPEDLLPRGAAPRRRHRRHAAPRLPVHAAADRRRWSAMIVERPLRRRARLAHPRRARRCQGGMPLYKYVANRFLTWRENLLVGDEALRVPHRLPRLLARGARDAAARRELRRLRLRQPDARAGDRTSASRSARSRARRSTSPEASSINFARSVTYGLGCLRTAAQLYAQRRGCRHRSRSSRSQGVASHPTRVARFPRSEPKASGEGGAEGALRPARSGAKGERRDDKAELGHATLEADFRERAEGERLRVGTGGPVESNRHERICSPRPGHSPPGLDGTSTIVDSILESTNAPATSRCFCPGGGHCGQQQRS